MPFPIIVHNLDHAQAACAAASELHVPLVLQTAPGAIFYAGSLYLLEMFKKVQCDYPQLAATFILDCGDDGAETIAAMRMGHRHLRSTAPAPLREKLTDIAAQHGVEMTADEYTCLDLCVAPDPQAASKEWLQRHGKS